MDEQKMTVAKSDEPLEFGPHHSSDMLFNVSKGMDEVVRLHVDGSITYSNGYTPTEAAKIFWGELVNQGLMCPHCSEPVFQSTRPPDGK